MGLRAVWQVVLIKSENLETEGHVERHKEETTIYKLTEKPGTEPSLTALRKN